MAQSSRLYLHQQISRQCEQTLDRRVAAVLLRTLWSKDQLIPFRSQGAGAKRTRTGLRSACRYGRLSAGKAWGRSS